MATGTAGTVAREYHTAQVHYLRKRILETGGQATVYTIGIVPAGALIIKPMSGVMVNVAASSATDKLMEIGTTANDDIYGTLLSLATVGIFVPLDEAVNYGVTVDTTITATLALTGAVGAALGVFDVIIAYVLSDS